MTPRRRRNEPESDPLLPYRRARGALLGLAVGDAMGTTTEFKVLPAPEFPILADGPQTGIVGKGPFSLRPGQVTDDTQMASCLAASLLELGDFSAQDVARRYRGWLPHAFDVGVLTRSVLSASGPLPLQERAALDVWLRSGRKTAGNGSLMRTAPLGVFFCAADQAQDRVRASLQDSAITHVDPRCQLACVAFNASIAAAVRGGPDLSPEALVEAAERELMVGAPLLSREWEDLMVEVNDAVRDLKEDLQLARRPDPELYGPELHLTQSHKAGFVRVAFRLAYWELLHAPSFEAALIDITNRGGDADTNAAIAGALLGAFHGEASIPGEWCAQVLEALQGRALDPLWSTYHPRVLLQLVDARFDV